MMDGGVICHPDYPVQVTDQLELKILVLDTTNPILKGFQLEFRIHHAKGRLELLKLLLLDRETRKETKKSPPRCLLVKQDAVVEVVLQQPVCGKVYSNCQALGSLLL